MQREYITKKICCALGLAAFAGLLGFFADKSGKEEADPVMAKQVSADTPGWMLHTDEPVTLDWYVNYSWFKNEWGNNLVSKKITEETGVDVNFITPSGNEVEKLNALIASDSLPDILTIGWWESQLDEMIEKDMIYPLNELADKYDLYFWKVSDPDTVNWYT